MVISHEFRKRITNFISCHFYISSDYLDWDGFIYIHCISNVIDLMLFDLGAYKDFYELKKDAYNKESIILGEIWKSKFVKELEARNGNGNSN